MTKVFKVTMYVVDPYGHHTKEYIENNMQKFDGMFNRHLTIEESEIPDYNVFTEINYKNCSLEDCECYFTHKEGGNNNESN